MKNPFKRLFSKKAATNEFKDNEYQRKKDACIFMIAHYSKEAAVFSDTPEMVEYDASMIAHYQQELLGIEAKHQLGLI